MKKHFLTLQRNEAKIEVNVTRLICFKTTKKKNSHENSSSKYNCMLCMLEPALCSQTENNNINERKLTEKKKRVHSINGHQSEVECQNLIKFYTFSFFQIYIETIENRDRERIKITTLRRDNNYSHFQSLRMSTNNRKKNNDIAVIECLTRKQISKQELELEEEKNNK